MSKETWDDRAFVDQLVQQSRMPEEVAVPLALEMRIMAGFDAAFAPRPALQHYGLLRQAIGAIWPGASLWQPGFALALALVCGLGLGMLPSLHTSTADSTLQQLTDATPALDMAGDI